MNAILIKHNPKDDYARVLLNHTLYGRLVYRNYRGRKQAYYMPGLLDNIKFMRRTKGGECLIFGEIDIPYFQDTLDIFGEVIIKEANFLEDELIEYEQSAQTGHEYWKNKAKEKNIMFKIKGK